MIGTRKLGHVLGKNSRSSSDTAGRSRTKVRKDLWQNAWSERVFWLVDHQDRAVHLAGPAKHGNGSEHADNVAIISGSWYLQDRYV
jgi:hypothetical protein